MVELSNGLLFIFGTILILAAFKNFTRSFAAWLAVFPLVVRLTPVEAVVVPTCRFITFGLFFVALIKFGTGRKKLPRTPVWGTYLLFLVLASISALVSSQPLESLGKTFTYVEPPMWALMAALCALTDKNAMRTLVKGILLGLIGVTAYGVTEILFQRNVLYDIGLLRSEADYINEVRFGFSGRIMSTIGQPVGTSLYLMVALPLVIFYAKYLTNSLVRRLAWLAVLIVGLVCLIATGARTGYAGILIVPLSYLLFNISGWRAMLAVLSTYALFFVMVQYLLPPEFLEYNVNSLQIQVADPRNEAVGNVVGRINLTQRLLEIAPERPFLGFGPGFVPRMDLAGNPDFVGLGGSENQYAMLLVETGAIGLFGYIVFVATVLRILLRARRHPETTKAQWAAFAGSVFLSIMAVAVTVTVITSPAMMLIMTYLGIVVVFESERAKSVLKANEEKAIGANRPQAELVTG